ncbi:MAG: universal stress protein [Betaproteobacteria bacterium]|nr:universal stress protein [Betaproteobacteria bacterium]
MPDGFRRQRLLLATDGSEFSHAPQKIAIALARSFGVTLDVMTSVPTPEDEEMARARLAVVTRAALVAGVDAEEIVRHGKQAVKEVIAAATSADTNILIIGRRPPRGDLKERLLGDVAEQIIDQAHCHVLIAGWQSQMWRQRILVACDESMDSDRIAEIAGQIAKATRTPLTLVAAVSTDREHENAADGLALKAARIRVEGIECDSLIVDGAPQQAIPVAAHELGADLVVIGYQQSLGRGTADQIIGRLDCAVLVVRSGADAPQIDNAVAKQS